MSKTSNLTTLRKKKNNFNLINSNSRAFMYGFKFSNTLKYLLNKKDILITDMNINFSNNICYIFLDLFYKTKKINSYKNKIYSKKKNNIKIKKKFAFFVSKQFKIIKTSAVFLKVQNINKKITLKEIKIFYNLIKRFLNLLFIRRFNLFIDFVKLTALFSNKIININSYLFIIGQIFKVLPKKRHNIFIFFLKLLFAGLINEKNIKGIKFILNGKILGKSRSSTIKIVMGSIPIQTISASIEFSKIHVYTLQGAFGLKMWVHL